MAVMDANGWYERKREGIAFRREVLGQAEAKHDLPGICGALWSLLLWWFERAYRNGCYYKPLGLVEGVATRALYRLAVWSTPEPQAWFPVTGSASFESIPPMTKEQADSGWIDTSLPEEWKGRPACTDEREMPLFVDSSLVFTERQRADAWEQRAKRWKRLAKVYREDRLG